MVLVDAGRAEALARAELLAGLVALGLALAVLGPRASFARFLLANAFLFFGCLLAAGTAGLAALARSLTSASSDAADGIAWSPIFPVAKAVVEGHFWNALALEIKLKVFSHFNQELFGGKKFFLRNHKFDTFLKI